MLRPDCTPRAVRGGEDHAVRSRSAPTTDTSPDDGTRSPAIGRRARAGLRTGLRRSRASPLLSRVLPPHSITSSSSSSLPGLGAVARAGRRPRPENNPRSIMAGDGRTRPLLFHFFKGPGPAPTPFVFVSLLLPLGEEKEQTKRNRLPWKHQHLLSSLSIRPSRLLSTN